MGWCENIITHPRSVLVKEQRPRMTQRKEDRYNHHSLHYPVTQGQCHTQNTAGENRVFAAPWGHHPPTTSLEVTVHCGDDLKPRFSFILLLPISVLIFTHFSPNYYYFLEQYIYITRRGEKRKQVLVNHCNFCVCKWLLVKETVHGGELGEQGNARPIP